MPEKELRTVVSIVIPHRQGQGDGRKFVMVRDAGKWCPPGGRLEGKDYDVLAAAHREVKEETGLCVVLNKFVGLYSFESPNGNLVYDTAFSAVIESGSLRSRNHEEIDSVGYFSLEEIREMGDRGELRSNPANIAVVEDFIRGQQYPLSIFKRLKTQS